MPRVRETQGSWPFAPHHYFPWQFLSLQQTLWDADELYNTIFCRQNQVRVSFSQSVTPEDSCLLACLLAACCCDWCEGGLKVFLLFPSPSRFVYATRGPRVQRPHYWWNCRRNSLVRTNYYSKYVCRCYALLAGGALCSGGQPRLEAAAASGYYYGIVLLRCRKLLWRRRGSWDFYGYPLPSPWNGNLRYHTEMLKCFILFLTCYWYLNSTK